MFAEGFGSADGAATASGARDPASVAALVAELEVLDVPALDLGELRTSLASLARVKGWHDGLHVRLSRRLRDLAAEIPSILPEADIAKASKSSQREATQATKRVATLDAVPALEAALAMGECSPEHVDSLGRAMKRLKPEQRDALAADGERITAIAKSSTPEQFDKHLSAEIARLDRNEGGERLANQRRAARFRSWTDRDTGMVCFRGELDPETGLTVVSRIDAAVDAMFHAGVPDECPEGDAKQHWMRAQALTRLVCRRNPRSTTTSAAQSKRHASRPGDDPIEADAPAAASGAYSGAAPWAPTDIGSLDTDILDVIDNRCEMVIVIDLETIINGLHKKSIISNGHNIDLPLESYRRMACNAAIIPAVLNSDGVCVDLGREQRLANRAQRRALAAMYDTCGIDGCTVSSRHCQPHHIRWWTRRGDTDLCNLLPLCSRHHHAVHEGGWQLTMHADRSITIAYPDGRIQTNGPPGRHRKRAA